MDDEAFLPLHSAELTGESATHIVQFCSIIDDVTKLAVAQDLASVKGSPYALSRTVIVFEDEPRDAGALQ
jgi:hypothetical protein